MFVAVPLRLATKERKKDREASSPSDRYILSDVPCREGIKTKNRLIIGLLFASSSEGSFFSAETYISRQTLYFHNLAIRGVLRVRCRFYNNYTRSSGQAGNCGEKCSIETHESSTGRAEKIWRFFGPKQISRLTASILIG